MLILNGFCGDTSNAEDTVDTDYADKTSTDLANYPIELMIAQSILLLASQITQNSLPRIFVKKICAMGSMPPYPIMSS